MTLVAWHPQSTLFRVLADHLGLFPNLPRVIVLQGGSLGIEAEAVLQIGTSRSRGETNGAPAVLMWAKTLAEPKVHIREHAGSGRLTNVWVTGGIDDLSVAVWDVDEGELYRLLDPARRDTEITLDQLAQYVATGVLEAL
ncbi:hypothetical protein ABZ215_13820 [Amycolatopsis sp. NPDC006131]|uniref:hypothetical protein n=1 Tax=Amycolatopsis sp. NPDC006131 TaxID=3156731 RepID=UPI0033AF976E